MTNNEAIQLIFEKYRFGNQVPVEVRNHFFESGRRNLKHILRKNGKGGLIVVGAVNLMYAAKRFGVSVNLAHAYVAVLISSVVVAGLVSAASVAAAYRFIEHKSIGTNPPVIEETKKEQAAVAEPRAAVKENSVIRERSASPLRSLYNTHKHVEKIFLKDGTVLSGVVNEKDGTVYLITPEGTLNVSRDDIERIEYISPDSL